ARWKEPGEGFKKDAKVSLEWAKLHIPSTYDVLTVRPFWQVTAPEEERKHRLYIVARTGTGSAARAGLYWQELEDLVNKPGVALKEIKLSTAEELMGVSTSATQAVVYTNYTMYFGTHENWTATVAGGGTLNVKAFDKP